MAGTVTVACKMPNGLRLRVHDLIASRESTMGGEREIKVSAQRGEDVVLNGYTAPYGKMPNAPITGGYALTHGVDADFFNAWMEQNKESAIVKNRLVFAHEKPDFVDKRAKDNAATKSGLEPVDPENLPKGIQKADVK